MSNEEETPKSKQPRYMKWYPEKWMSGSLRDEFSPAQRGVWADLLCLGFENNPPGQIDFVTIRRLAHRLSITNKLLISTIRNAALNKKIRLIKVWVCPKTGEKFEEFELTLDQLLSNLKTMKLQKSKVGVPLYAIIFLRWNEYQPRYLWQKPYKKKDSEDA